MILVSTPGRRRRLVVLGRGIALFAAVLLVGATLAACGSGSSAEIKADELTGAEFTNLYPSSQEEPFTYPLDMNDQWLRERLLSSYASMAPWSGDEAGRPDTDVQLTMFFTDDRKTVLSLARDDHSFVLLEQYKGDKLKDSFYMQPKLMYEFVTELVVEPGGW